MNKNVSGVTPQRVAARLQHCRLSLHPLNPPCAFCTLPGSSMPAGRHCELSGIQHAAGASGCRMSMLLGVPILTARSASHLALHVTRAAAPLSTSWHSGAAYPGTNAARQSSASAPVGTHSSILDLLRPQGPPVVAGSGAAESGRLGVHRAHELVLRA